MIQKVIQTSNSDTPEKKNCDPKITAFFRMKLLVFDLFFFSNSELVPIAIQTLGLSPL